MIIRYYAISIFRDGRTRHYVFNAETHRNVAGPYDDFRKTQREARRMNESDARYQAARDDAARQREATEGGDR